MNDPSEIEDVEEEHPDRSTFHPSTSPSDPSTAVCNRQFDLLVKLWTAPPTV